MFLMTDHEYCSLAGGMGSHVPVRYFFGTLKVWEAGVCFPNNYGHYQEIKQNRRVVCLSDRF